MADDIIINSINSSTSACTSFSDFCAVQKLYKLSTVFLLPKAE